MTEREYHLAQSKAQGQAQSGWIVALCIFWVIASIVGFAVQAFAATPSGLRGAINTPARAQTPVRNQTPQAWLGSSVWRVGPCETAQNFQAFNFSSAPKVEVGSGKVGEGEQLELLVVANDPNGLIQIETRVCAPVGCNRTIERYKKLGPNQMQEWHFEGRLPNITPYVIVANGAAVDGSGPGRVFNRCGS
jgi:hypothetical protein